MAVPCPARSVRPSPLSTKSVPGSTFSVRWTFDAITPESTMATFTLPPLESCHAFFTPRREIAVGACSTLAVVPIWQEVFLSSVTVVILFCPSPPIRACAGSDGARRDAATQTAASLPPRVCSWIIADPPWPMCFRDRARFPSVSVPSTPPGSRGCRRPCIPGAPGIRRAGIPNRAGRRGRRPA